MKIKTTYRDENIREKPKGYVLENFPLIQVEGAAVDPVSTWPNPNLV